MIGRCAVCSGMISDSLLAINFIGGKHENVCLSCGAWYARIKANGITGKLMQ